MLMLQELAVLQANYTTIPLAAKVVSVMATTCHCATPPANAVLGFALIQENTAPNIKGIMDFVNTRTPQYLRADGNANKVAQIAFVSPVNAHHFQTQRKILCLCG